jgi:hypothetical protein
MFENVDCRSREDDDHLLKAHVVSNCYILFSRCVAGIMNGSRRGTKEMCLHVVPDQGAHSWISQSSSSKKLSMQGTP